MPPPPNPFPGSRDKKNTATRKILTLPRIGGVILLIVIAILSFPNIDRVTGSLTAMFASAPDQEESRKTQSEFTLGDDKAAEVHADTRPKKSIVSKLGIGRRNGSEGETQKTDSKQRRAHPQTSQDRKKDLAAANDRRHRDDLPEGALSIAGSVLNEAGRPLIGIDVAAIPIHLFNEDENIDDGSGERQTYTDKFGGFEFNALPDGEYTVRAGESLGYAAATKKVRAGTENVNLVLNEQRKIWVHGRITNTFGEPLPDVAVILTTQPDDIGFSTPSGAYGVYITVKRDSAINLRFQAQDHEDQTITLTEDDWFKISQLEQDVVMEPLKTLTFVSGTVTNTEGLPIANETVYLKGSSRQYSGRTDNTGQYIIDDVESGTEYMLWIRPTGPYKDFQQQNLEVPASGLDNLNVVLEPVKRGTISGWMIDIDGNPIPNFTLFLRSRNSAQPAIRVTSDNKGFFATDDAPDGTLRFETSSYPLFMVSGIRLSPGEEKDLDLVLDIGNYEIQGRTEDPMGQPVAGANVSLSWTLREEGLTYESFRKTVSDAQGFFRFNRLGFGKHTLTIKAPRFRTLQIDHQTGDSLGGAPGKIGVQLEYESQ